MRLGKYFLVMMTAWPRLLPADVLIRAPLADRLEYRARLAADPDLQSPSAFLAERRPQSENRRRLLDQFANAQKTFLERSGPEAAAKFGAIKDLWTLDDWTMTDTKIFAHAFLRRAQLSEEATERATWLRRAALTGAPVDKDLFPPPLLDELRAAGNGLGAETLAESWFESGWDLIIVNGVTCAPGKCGALKRALDLPSRLTFLSDRYQTRTVIVDGEWPEAPPASEPWARGDCASAQLASAATRLPGAQVHWGAICAAPAAVDLQPRLPAPDAVPRVDIPADRPAFYKSKWFWASVGLAVVAVIVVDANRKSDERTPTNTYGY